MKISSTLGRDESKLNVINGCMGKRACRHCRENRPHGPLTYALIRIFECEGGHGWRG